MSVGQSLVAAREASGLDIEALAAATRIRATLIRAIEADNFSLCGGDVYARGHIRSIARVLGVDAEPLVAEFDAAHPRETIDHTVGQISEDWRPVTRDLKRPAYGAAMAAALLIGVCAVVIIGLLNPKSPGTVAGGPSTPVIITTTTAPASQAPSTAAGGSSTTPPVLATPTGTPSDGVAIAPRNGVNLRLRVTGAQCWISVTDSTGKQTQATLHKGDVRDFHDDTQLRLTIGDAGALTIIDNGKELPPLGSPGAVVNRTFKATQPTVSAG
jgi:cytoskeletal protein RodZ